MMSKNLFLLSSWCFALQTGPLYNLRVRPDPVLRAMPLMVYEMMDLDTIQSRIINNHYSSIMQFEHDVVTILHNVAIIYGGM